MVSYLIVLLLSAVASGSACHIRSACGVTDLHTANDESTYGGKSSEENNETKEMAQHYKQKSSSSAMKGGRTLQPNKNKNGLKVPTFIVFRGGDSNGDSVYDANGKEKLYGIFQKKLEETTPAGREGIRKRLRLKAKHIERDSIPQMPPRDMFKGTSQVVLLDHKINDQNTLQANPPTNHQATPPTDHQPTRPTDHQATRPTDHQANPPTEKKHKKKSRNKGGRNH